MRFNIPERFENFHDGDMEHWLNFATEQFGDCADALAQKEIIFPRCSLSLFAWPKNAISLP